MDFKELLSPDFEIGSLSFHIVKANAEEGFPLLEMVRSAVTDPTSMRLAAGADQGDAYAALMRAVLSVDPVKVAKLRDELFKYVDVKVQGSSFQRLPKVRAVVMNEIEAPDIYEIIVRAIAVNFSKSFLGLLNRLGLGAQEQGVGTLGS